MKIPQDARCQTHQAQATDACPRCGLFVCAECGALSICGPCLALQVVDDAQAKSTRGMAQGSAILGVLTYCFFSKVRAIGGPLGNFVILAIGCIGLSCAILALRRRRGITGVLPGAVSGLVVNGSLVVLAVLLIVGILVTT